MWEDVMYLIRILLELYIWTERWKVFGRSSRLFIKVQGIVECFAIVWGITDV